MCKQQQPISQSHLNDLISATFRTTARSYNEVGKYLYQNVFDSRAPGTIVALIAATTPLLEVGRHEELLVHRNPTLSNGPSARLAFPLLQFLLGRKGNHRKLLTSLRLPSQMTNASLISLLRLYVDCLSLWRCYLSS